MLLDRVYVSLKSLGLAPSHRAFSADFLSRSPRYYDDLIASRREPSTAVVSLLATRIHKLRQKLSATDPNQAAVPILIELTGYLLVELERRSIIALPARRKRPRAADAEPAHLAKPSSNRTYWRLR